MDSWVCTRIFITFKPYELPDAVGVTDKCLVTGSMQENLQQISEVV